MTPREFVAAARVPGAADGEDELRLYRRGSDFVIGLGRNELMNSRVGGSEEALAVEAIRRLRPRPAPRILIGGYGMGFTLRAALEALRDDARVMVAELVPEIIDWARGPMAALTAGYLDDARVELVEGDVAASIADGGWDAVLLDVDNGPDGLTRAGNDRLYSSAGLAATRRALAPGGVLAVWSAAPDPRFVKRLAQAGFAVEELAVRARANGKGPRHVIWFATWG